mgnify:CR=1 FL=1
MEDKNADISEIRHIECVDRQMLEFLHNFTVAIRPLLVNKDCYI